MAIRMMTSKEEFEKNPTNIEVVKDYHGHAVEEVIHSYGRYVEGKLVDECPHRNNATWESNRKIFADCPKECRHCDPLYMKSSHVGLVLSLRERNGYDDSDFYALIWNPEKGAPEEIEYATTRGWTYPNGAAVDATPEVLAAYEEYLAKKRAEYDALRAAEEAKKPTKGKSVKVVRGRKVPKGTQGRVFWYGTGSKYMGGEETRVGIESNTGEKFFLPAAYVEVVTS